MVLGVGIAAACAASAIKWGTAVRREILHHSMEMTWGSAPWQLPRNSNACNAGRVGAAQGGCPTGRVQWALFRHQRMDWHGNRVHESWVRAHVRHVNRRQGVACRVAAVEREC